MMRKQTGYWLSAVLLAAFFGGHAVADIGDTQTFDAPTIGDGWTCDACLVNGWNAGEVAVDEGDDGVGDDALLYVAGGRGFHLFTWEGLDTADYNFLGDLLGVNLVAVRFRARHSGIGEDVSLRVYLFDGFEDGIENWGLSNGAAAIASTDTTWQTYTISLLVEDMEYGDSMGTPHSEADLRVVLSDVVQFGLRHDPENTGPGVPAWVDSEVYFDDIQLIVDTDGDGVTDDIDLCPDTPAGDAVDDVGCSNVQVDADADGICDVDAASGGPSLCTGIDECLGTEIPEAAPLVRLGRHRWTLDNTDGTFTQRRRRAWGHFDFTTEHTRGCSCDQIITESGYTGLLETINRNYGCSTRVMMHWVHRP